ncbi:hypothetical protein SeMB42_g06595 [Synchytrium endobioticum]|uniref:Uncharacterized protein n=1 Tax=Synchytrium endobioticum TaxID=286115 RepID=A0A507CCB1_9FUNG|nr:hypothetical protein SeMB42_g06595 [Synchytrium endobioticum]TPX41888.1 hypothetical protein SeLEV6574_g05868 [Synchytrium endobioticum]TPX41894.1 hypothetical protein SeLEV6574_g05875 [Synchytrium endobioticum]
MHFSITLSSVLITIVGTTFVFAQPGGMAGGIGGGPGGMGGGMGGMGGPGSMMMGPQQEPTGEGMHVSQAPDSGAPPGGPEGEGMHVAGGDSGGYGYTPYAYALGTYANNFGLARKRYGVANNAFGGTYFGAGIGNVANPGPYSGYGSLYGQNTHAFGLTDRLGNGQYYNTYAVAPYGGYGGY